MLVFDPRPVRAARVQRACLAVASALLGCAASSAFGYTVSVANTSQLNAALYAVSAAGDAGHKTDASNTITLTADIVLNADLWAVRLPYGHSLRIDGGGHVLDGASAHRGFFVLSDNVTIANLTLQHTLARGGDGQGGGGGGAGLGGGVFVYEGLHLTLDHVNLAANKAAGGNGGTGYNCGGGGGMGGKGGAGGGGVICGGGGGFGTAATGGDGGGVHNGGAGRIAGAAPGGSMTSFGTAGGTGGSNAGGGAGSPVNVSSAAGGGSGGGGPGNGGFGGGGGGDRGQGFAGGYGGGGGGGSSGVEGGRGGFGGGGGGGQGFGQASGGFGGGQGGYSAGGGGGLGAGGAGFVDSGVITLIGGSQSGGAVTGGSNTGGGGGNGGAFGAAFFINGPGQLHFAPPAGETMTIADTIADTHGSGGSLAIPDYVYVEGAGTVVFGGNNTFSGNLEVVGSTLQVAKDASLGTSNALVTISHGGTLAVAGTSFTTTTHDFTIDASGGAIAVLDPANTWKLSNALAGSGPLTKRGVGTLAIGSGNAFSGNCEVQEGTLRVDGSLAGAASVTVDANAMLGGAGSVGGIVALAQSIVAPHAATPATMHASSLSMQPQSIFSVRASGTRTDQLFVGGAIDITGATLDFRISTPPARPQSYTLIRGTGTPVQGEFSGLPQDSTLLIDGGQFIVNYHGGAGGDVVLQDAEHIFADGFEAP